MAYDYGRKGSGASPYKPSYGSWNNKPKVDYGKIQGDKDVSIVVSGAIRDAYLMVCMDPGFRYSKLTAKERRAWVDRMVRENLEFVASNRETWEDLYNRTRLAAGEKKDVLKQKVGEDVLIEEGTNEPGIDDTGTGEDTLI
jgi:hypothetical protein